MAVVLNMSKHQHNFLSVDHSASERKTWWVIALCTASMFLEIGCGIRFGSLALIADGLHMSTHAFAFLVTALSYSYARKHSDDPRFVFGTGKVGDLAAFSSAIILFLIALFIMYEGLYRYLHPQTINYSEAIPVAFVGLTVNILSGVILGGGFTCCNTVEDVGSGHGHTHGHTIEHFEYDIESDNTRQHNSYLGGGGLRDHGHDHHTNCGSHTTKDQENAHHSKEHG